MPATRLRRRSWRKSARLGISWHRCRPCATTVCICCTAGTCWRRVRVLDRLPTRSHACCIRRRSNDDGGSVRLKADPVKILLAWSSCKDSAWALHLLNQQYPGAVAGLLTTVNEAMDRVAMHGVRRAVLEAQARAAGLPLHVVHIPHPCPNEIYEAQMRAAIADACAGGFTHAAFGDLFLEDIRRYREEKLAGTGLEPLFPLFDAAPGATTPLARQMIAGGLRARITCLNPKSLDRRFAGREFDAALLEDLPPSID